MTTRNWLASTCMPGRSLAASSFAPSPKRFLTAMLAAFADAARAPDRDNYLMVAERSADFLLRELRQENGRLLRSWKDGEAKLNGYLEDLSYLIEGLLELHRPLSSRVGS